ncbi:MAG: VWA domain-containing protein [Candidatus Sulfotelmatobacter sp.]
MIVAPDKGSVRIRRSVVNAVSFVLAIILLTFFFPLELVDAQSAPQASSPGTASPDTASPYTAAGPTQGNDRAASQAPTQSADKNSPEIATRDVPPTFKVNVKLVVVRVVARDFQGRAVGSLQRQDFQVFDNGKPQTITQFSVEKAGARTTMEPNRVSPANESSHEPGENVKAPVAPQRYTAYLFDDVHLKFGDLTYARQAAERHLASLQPTDRTAIFSTSGQTVLDFTDDHAKLHDTLLTLRSRPVATGNVANPCPDVSYYMADLIINKEDMQALQTAALDALHCAFDDEPHAMPAAQNLAKQTARRSIDEGEAESRLALGVLKDVVRRIAPMPGQRSIVFVSPGFQTPEIEYEYVDVIDKALHSEVIIGAIDARGLYVAGATSDSSKPGNGSNLNPAQEAQELPYAIQSASLDEDVLRVMADGTGGIFFHNNNDLDEGFNRVAAPPEYSYVLGFVPQTLKPDGSFHTLKVKLNSPLKLNLQARRGYYAAKHLDDPAEETKREIEDAVFSQDESHGLPVELRTQFYKSSDDDAKISVLAKVDVKHIRFRKEEGRNHNDLTVVSAVFDRNGNYLKGEEKVVQMRWKDETLESELGSGIVVESSFDVKPGTYRVRLIVRDSEGQSMTAESSAVEIP